MKKILSVVVIGIIAVFAFNLTIFSGDMQFFFMRNNHDTLLIGEVIEIDGNETVIRSADFIVSTGTTLPHREQLRPEIARVSDLWTVASLYENEYFEVGDYVLVSLNWVENDRFLVAMGAYRVDSLDYRTLTVKTADPMTAAMLTDFVNSGGRYNDFASAPTWVVRRHNGEETVIWEADEEMEFPSVAVPEQPIGRPGGQNYILFVILGAGLIVVVLLCVVIYKKLKL